MLTMNWTNAEQREFEALIAANHRIEVEITVLDMDHNHVGEDLSWRLLDGQVTVDATAQVSRSTDLTLFDPFAEVRLDSGSPNDGALFADRMLEIVYCVISPLGDIRYEVHIFTGPITKLERDGVVIKVEAQGKEILGTDGSWIRKTWKKRSLKTGIIRFVVGTIMGEARMSIKDREARIPRAMGTGPDVIPWDLVRSLASSFSMHAFYDALGWFRVRTFKKNPVFVFRGGPGGTVKTKPKSSFTMEGVYNCVEVVGRKPRGEKRIRVRRVAPKNHELSPRSLGRKEGAAPRYIPLVVEDDSIKTKKAAKALAKKLLEKGLNQAVEVEFESLPVPHLEPEDMVEVDTPEFHAKFRLRQFTIPLKAGGTSTIGYVKNVKPNRRAIRGRKKAISGRK